MFGRPSLITIIYVVIGVVIASDHHYFSHVNSFERVISAVLAIVLWPLVLLHVNLHVRF